MVGALRLMLLVVHVIGGMISFIVFSYQYVKDQGFISWLLFGEIIPGLKSIVWEVFLVMALLGSSSPSTDNSTSREELWWQGEYPAFVEEVGSANNFTMETAFRTGPQGNE